MPFGAALTFDAETDVAVRGLWQAQADAGLAGLMPGSGYPPHMTLLLAEDGDIDGMRAALALLAREMPPLLVSFLAIGVFPAEYGVVFLAPVANRELLDAHAAIWAAVHPHLANLYDHYRPGVWVPHVTLAYRLPPEQIGPAASFLAHSAWPRAGQVTSILFGDFQVGSESHLETVKLGWNS